MNYDKYIGLPYKSNGRDESGLDCWGLVRLFYKNELGIDLPSYSELYTGGIDPSISTAIQSNMSDWEVVPAGTPGDVCLFNIYGEPAHVGIYIGSNKFLHIRESKDSVIESLGNQQWSKRFVGFYKYSQNKILTISGRPHPLQTSVVQDYLIPGRTLQECVDFINDKYKISERLASRLIVLINDEIIPREKWATTVLEPNHIVSYKTVPEGGQGGRTLLMFAVTLAAPWIATQLAPGLAASASAAGASWGTKAGFAALKFAITAVGMALVNAIAPIRMPKDPGTSRPINLFSGSANQANRYGAVPVVLGKMRTTGLHGATPYVDTLTDTTLLNLLIVWGFGPLFVEDIRVGTKPIEDFYDKEFAQNIPQPETLYGTPTDDSTKFDKLYGGDVEQAAISPIELVNNAEDGNPWQTAVLENPCSELAIAYSFPEGMRQIVVSGNDAGQVRDATASIEIQIRKYTTNPATDGEAWQDTQTYFLEKYSLTATGSGQQYAYQKTFTPASITVLVNNSYTSRIGLYRKYALCLVPGGDIQLIAGTASDTVGDPSSDLLTEYRNGNYASLTGTDNKQYSFEPAVPPAYIKIYTFIINPDGALHYQNGSYYTTFLDQYVHNGLEFAFEQLYTSSGEDTFESGSVVKVKAGSITNPTQNSVASGEVKQVFSSLNMVGGTTIRTPSTPGGWSSLLKEKGVWSRIDNNIPSTVNIVAPSVTFTWSGYYYVEASMDDEGGIYIDNRPAVLVSKPGSESVVSNLIYLEAGTYPVRITSKNTEGNDPGAAFNITYHLNGGLNNMPNPSTVLTFGSPGFYNKRKDAFNFVYRVKSLPRGKYQIRTRRTNSDVVEPSQDLRNYHKVQFFSLTGYDYVDDAGNPIRPIKDLPGTGTNKAYLAKTAIRIQSTNKANGSLDGINAIVQSICRVWDSDAQQWVANRPTSNPAALFLHVLTHPSNAYRVEESEIANKIDLQALQEWSEFCDTPNPSTGKPVLEYNGIISSTQSVLDTLRDICAAGLASPNYVDGKWTVVVDKPKSYVVQYFTPHNSKDFEATKILPRLPHGFRVMFNNKDKAYQPDEVIVYNYGYTKDNATVFEQLELPGVTNTAQAKYLARWHLAQLKLRPERYTINTDFEYLVCNRGDLVRVTHDVPMWGIGSGRIKAVGVDAVVLTEQVFLETGKSYRLRARLNSGNSAQFSIAPVDESGYYDYIVLTDYIDDSGTTQPLNTALMAADNLVMIGEVGKETQQLVVLSIEPTSNTGAQLTLVDYSPEIYSADLTDNGSLPAYNANISGRSNPLIQQTIATAPQIVSVTSDSNISDEIATGTYTNTTIVNFANTSNLTNEARIVELQCIIGNSDFENSSPANVYKTNKEVGSFIIYGLKTLTMYKFRARYTNATGTIVGPWSDIYYATINGKTTNNFAVDSLTMDLDSTFITATPSSTANKPSNFKTYEFRLYKDTGTEDFWELDTVANNILVMQDLSVGRFNLLDLPLPRISTEGITYRVACRAIDNNNNYSTSSALGTIVIKTIQ